MTCIRCYFTIYLHIIFAISSVRCYIALCYVVLFLCFATTNCCEIKLNIYMLMTLNSTFHCLNLILQLVYLNLKHACHLFTPGSAIMVSVSTLLNRTQFFLALSSVFIISPTFLQLILLARQSL